MVAYRILIDLQYPGYITYSTAVERQLNDFFSHARLVDTVAVLPFKVAAI